VQFAVKNKQYFVNFVPEEGQWFVFTPTGQGFHRIPVVHDDQLPVVGSVIINPEDVDRKLVN
jgi:hypothetical protein